MGVEYRVWRPVGGVENLDEYVVTPCRIPPGRRPRRRQQAMGVLVARVEDVISTRCPGTVRARRLSARRALADLVDAVDFLASGGRREGDGRNRLRLGRHQVSSVPFWLANTGGSWKAFELVIELAVVVRAMAATPPATQLRCAKGSTHRYIEVTLMIALSIGLGWHLGKSPRGKTHFTNYRKTIRSALLRHHRRPGVGEIRRPEDVID